MAAAVMVRAAIAAAATLVTMVIPVVSAVVVSTVLLARASSVLISAVVLLLVRCLATVRFVVRRVVAPVVLTVVVVLFVLVLDINLGAELDIGVDFRVIVLLDIDVTVHDGAVVIAVDVHVSSVAQLVAFAALAVSLAAAAAAGGLALLADVLDAAGQVLADGGHDGVDRHDGLNGFHEDIQDRADESDPLGDLAGNLRFGDGSRKAPGAYDFDRCGNTAADDIADGAHDGVVDAVDGVCHLRERLAEGTRRGRDAVDRTGDDGLALQVRAHCFAVPDIAACAVDCSSSATEARELEMESQLELMPYT